MKIMIKLTSFVVMALTASLSNAGGTSIINQAGTDHVKAVPLNTTVPNLPPGLTPTTAADGTFRYGSIDPQGPLENPPKKGTLLKTQAPLIFNVPSPIYNSAFSGVSNSTTLSVTGGSGNGSVTFQSVDGGCTINGSTIVAPNTNFDTTKTCIVKATKAGAGGFNTASVTGNVTVYGFYLFQRIGVPSTNNEVCNPLPGGRCTRASITVLSCRSDGDLCQTGAGGYGTSNLQLTGENCSGTYNTSTRALSDWTMWVYLLSPSTYPDPSCVISATVKGKVLKTKTGVANLNNFPNPGAITYLPGGVKFAAN